MIRPPNEEPPLTDSTAPTDPLAQLMLAQMPETVEDMRKLLDGFAGFLNADLPEVGGFRAALPLFEGVTADLITPKGSGPFPVLVYLHGGGWICGSPTTHNKLAHRFAEAGYLVLNVDYRLAPEHPFPTPFEDCVEAVRWAHREISAFRGDPERIALGGDSAGGNLTAAVAAALQGDPACPKAALLLYGVFDFATLGQEAAPSDSPMPLEIGGHLLELMAGSYLGSDRDDILRDPRVSPLHAADRLPPCHVMVGGADPLTAQAEALVAELTRAGIEHEHFVDALMPHGYAQIEMLPAARPAIDRILAFLQKHL